MGKIKVLFAAENGDDDLYDDEEIKEFLEAKKKHKKEVEEIANKIEAHVDYCNDDIEEIFDIELCLKVTVENWTIKAKNNYNEICAHVGEALIDTMCEEYNLDLSEKEYGELVGRATNIVISKYSERKERLIKRAKSMKKEFYFTGH